MEIWEFWGLGVGWGGGVKKGEGVLKRVLMGSEWYRKAKVWLSLHQTCLLIKVVVIIAKEKKKMISCEFIRLNKCKYYS